MQFSQWDQGGTQEIVLRFNALGIECDYHGSRNTGGVPSLPSYYVDCLPYTASLSRILGKDINLWACKLHEAKTISVLLAYLSIVRSMAPKCIMFNKCFINKMMNK